MKRCVHCDRVFAADDWTCPACGRGPQRRDNHLLLGPDVADHGDGFSPDYFAGLADVEDGHFWFQSRNDLLMWMMRRYFPSVDSILEIGCGTGFVLKELRRAFPNAQVSGSEVFFDALPFAAKRAEGATVFQMDARRMPFDDEFDVIGAFDVLEHIDEDERVLREMFRAVRAGGGIVITVPQHQWLWSAVDDISFHKRRYSRAGMISLIRACGFQPIRVTSFVSLLLPLMMLTRVRKSDVKVVDRLAEFRLGRATNAALRLVMNIERQFIRAGADLPAGGSLLVIARKPG